MLLVLLLLLILILLQILLILILLLLLLLLLLQIHLTRDDFDIVTENGKHLGPTAEFNAHQFQEMMKVCVRICR